MSLWAELKDTGDEFRTGGREPAADTRRAAHVRGDQADAEDGLRLGAVAVLLERPPGGGWALHQPLVESAQHGAVVRLGSKEGEEVRLLPGGVEQLRRDAERCAQRRHGAVDRGVELAERGLSVDELPAERGLLRLDGVEGLLAVGDQLAQLAELVAGGQLAEDAVEADEDAVEVGVAVVEGGAEHRQVGEVRFAGGDRLVEALATPGDAGAEVAEQHAGRVARRCIETVDELVELDRDGLLCLVQHGGDVERRCAGAAVMDVHVLLAEEGLGPDVGGEAAMQGPVVVADLQGHQRAVALGRLDGADGADLGAGLEDVTAADQPVGGREGDLELVVPGAQGARRHDRESGPSHEDRRDGNSCDRRLGHTHLPASPPPFSPCPTAPRRRR